MTTEGNQFRKPGTIETKFSKPPGVLPRNIQTWVIGGIALLMVVIIALSGGQNPKDSTGSRPEPTVPVIDPSQSRIEEYQARIEAQAQRLAAEQADLERNLAQASEPPPTSASPITLGRTRLRAPKSRLEAEAEKREYESLFSSNLALSHRRQPVAPMPYISYPPSEATGSAATHSFAPASKSGEGTGDADSGAHDGLDRSSGKRYRLFEGTFFETVLTNRLDGEFSGPVNCMVTTDVHSRDRRRVLIPTGSRILGEARRVETFGQQRLAVAFHRLIMPDGYSASLDRFKGLNQVGETGLRDKINRHYLQTFGVSLAIGAIAGLGQANTRYGTDVSGEDVYVQGAASSLSQSSLRILDRYLNVLPTHTIREGHRVKIYLSNDLLLPAYENHQMPEDL
jgi:type IV secretion system protein VirB10